MLNKAGGADFGDAETNSMWRKSIILLEESYLAFILESASEHADAEYEHHKVRQPEIIGAKKVKFDERMLYKCPEPFS
jgi:hypothetical protein